MSYRICSEISLTCCSTPMQGFWHTTSLHFLLQNHLVLCFLLLCPKSTHFLLNDWFCATYGCLLSLSDVYNPPYTAQKGGTCAQFVDMFIPFYIILYFHKILSEDSYKIYPIFQTFSTSKVLSVSSKALLSGSRGGMAELPQMEDWCGDHDIPVGQRKYFWIFMCIYIYHRYVYIYIYLYIYMYRYRYIQIYHISE